MAKHRVTRRDFMVQTAAAGAGVMLSTAPIAAQAGAASTALDVAEWSFFWVGDRREGQRLTLVRASCRPAAVISHRRGRRQSKRSGADAPDRFNPHAWVAPDLRAIRSASRFKSLA